MLKMVVIADKQTSLPFRGLGIETITCEESKEGEKILRNFFRKQDYGIIFISEFLAKEYLDVIEELSKEKSLPIITVIPDFFKRNAGIGEKRLNNLVKKAIGIEIS
ncbi:V-type ATP synthase subunit F [Candidatus Aerophobetes bacterium]|nr:V-type ATP synthase subunit F [Candidatus Aerophobetes bacterium]